MWKNIIKQKTTLASNIVFVVTVAVTVISLTSIVFPALVLGSFSEYKMPVNLFEVGVWAVPLLATNFILFGILLLYYKKKLPSFITKGIKFLFNFEISREMAFLVIVILIGIYICAKVGYLLNADPWEDFLRTIKPTLDRWTVQNFWKDPGNYNLAYFFGVASVRLFGIYTAIPFISSISILVLTYLTTLVMTGKRFAGTVSLAVLLQSGIFQTYDTVMTYPSFWVLFYLLSLYLIHKKWFLSPVSFILSIPSKPLTVAFLPITFLYDFFSDIPKRRKIQVAVTYAIIMLVLIGVFLIFHVNPHGQAQLDSHGFWSGFTVLSTQLRYDEVITLFLLPLVVGLFIAYRNGVRNAISGMSLLMGTLWLLPILPGISDFDNNPYRLLPFVVFFAIGVGILLSRKFKEQVLV